MCFNFRKNSKQIINSKFQLNDFVNFKHRDDVYFGNISKIYLLDNVIYYDIDIAGQCPTTCRGIPEDEIFGIHKI